MFERDDVDITIENTAEVKFRLSRQFNSAKDIKDIEGFLEEFLRR